MIIIDKTADIKLTQRLERTEATDLSRCIYFCLHDAPPVEGIKDYILDALQRHNFTDSTQLYLCEDGDIFILTPSVLTKDARNLILEMTSYCRKADDPDFSRLYEVKIHLNKLLLILEKKYLLRQRRQEEHIKQEARKLAEQKRNHILSISEHNKRDDIVAKRAHRNTPYIMMIEDDAFSRRLVDSLLRVKYSFTALPNADQAITTYISLAPDILFLDINLPNISGHDLLKRIIEIDPEAYVIMLSGNADKDNITQAMQLGAKGFIGKPFTRDKIFQYIERCPTIHPSR